ncbi:MAG TPA: DUF6259 domain-containing protein [Armatimonadota bacterium]|nr:DUF6259 domain-containing protein [Armatimonadota bacterium]HPO74759.1 DUF6259 domain-containing protein [Armatimonadota bacterium]
MRRSVWLFATLMALLGRPQALPAEPTTAFTVVNAGRSVWQGSVLMPLRMERLRGIAAVREGATPLAWQPAEGGVLVLLPGTTSTGMARRIVVEAGKHADPPRSDLQVTETANTITIANLYYRVEHPKRGNGGFPTSIRFNQSGVVEKGFVFEDRLFEKTRGSQAWRSDAEATARVLEAGPVQVVIETRAKAAKEPGNPRAVYRYHYRASSPVVEVTARIERDDDFTWSELHFLQISRKDSSFGRWAGGEPLQTGVFTDARKGYALSRWAMMANDEDAIGLSLNGTVSLYDGANSYYNYIQQTMGPFRAPAADLRARVYLGPARAPEEIRARLAEESQLQVHEDVAPGGHDRSVPSPQPVSIASGSLRLGFARPEEGLGATSLFSHRTGLEFLTPSEKPLVWRLVLRGRDLPDLRIDNTAAARCSAAETPSKDGKRLELTWEDIDTGEEKGALRVRVTVDLPKASPGMSLWRIDVDNSSERYGLWEVHFPLFARLSEKGMPDVAVPRGNWGYLYRSASAQIFGSYPSADWPMQFLLVNEGEHGLYLAAHDPGASPKHFAFTPGGEFRLTTPVEGMGVPGSDFRAPFPVAIGVYQGDWWQGAKRYREWALKQPWTRRGPVATRKDMPEAMKRLGLWMLASGTREQVVPRMLEAKRLFGVPMGVHWYNWHQIPFDVHYPDYFPTKPGFAEGVRELVKEGIIAMPYINGRLWDTANDNFAVGRAAACKQPDGTSTYIEEYGSGAKLAPMCPATKLWQEKVNEIVGRLIRECGVNAIYLDQIGAARPQLCFDPTHGHPLGGGRHWVDGYREMLDRVRAQTAGRLGITTENNAEPYMDNVDAFLVWNPRRDAEIPMMTAVYSGYTLYFSSPARTMEPLAFRMVQGRDFLWGCQPGWMGFELLDPANRENAEYLREVARYRAVAAEFVVTGELIGELRPVAPLASLEAEWSTGRGKAPAALPATLGTVWRARDGHVGLLIANLSDSFQRYAFRFEPGAWGLSGSDQWVVRRLTPGAGKGHAASPIALVSANDESLTQALAPREIRVLDLAPVRPGQASAIRARIDRDGQAAPTPEELPQAPRTDVRFVTPPRAGETTELNVCVWGGAKPVTDVRLLLHLPASWSVEPGRALVIDRLEPGEVLSFPVRCQVPEGAAGSVTVRADLVTPQPERRVPVAPVRPAATARRFAQPPTLDGDLSEWQGVEPIAVSAQAQSKVNGWKGTTDLAGKVRVAWDAKNLYVAAEVTDDHFDQSYREKEIWRGDCIQIAFRPSGPAPTPGYDGVHEFGLALTPGGPLIWKWLPDEHTVTTGTLVIKRVPGGLVYEAAIPWLEVGQATPVPGGCLGFSFTINDADGDGFRGWMEWTPGICGDGKDASPFGRLSLLSE